MLEVTGRHWSRLLEEFWSTPLSPPPISNSARFDRRSPLVAAGQKGQEENARGLWWWGENGGDVGFGGDDDDDKNDK